MLHAHKQLFRNSLHRIKHIIRHKTVPSKLETVLSMNEITVSSKLKTVLSMKEMPHPLALPLLGTKWNFIATGSSTTLHEYIHRRHKTLGPIFCESLGGRTELVFVSDPNIMKSLFLNLEGKYPEHILPEPWILYEKLNGSKRGLFFMHGEEWLTNRRIMNKHLLREGIDQWLEIPIKNSVRNFVEEWDQKAKNGTFTLDLESEFYKLSVNVIMNVLLGTENPTKTSKHAEELLQLFARTVKKIFQATNRLYSLPTHLCEQLNLKVWRDFKQSVDLSLHLGQKIVSDIMEKKHKTNGLIERIGEMNDELVKRIITDLVIAAGDTTAYTTMWILLLLSENDEAKREIQSNKDFTKHVVRESMRLYPVAPFLTRIIPRDDIIGSYKINKGTPIIASIYTSGRDERYFSRANEFLPYRWDRNDPRRQELANHEPSASLPFALGARSCIGKKIAMIQLTEITKQIVNNFDFTCTNSADVKPIMSLVLVPDRKINLIFNKK